MYMGGVQIKQRAHAGPESPEVGDPLRSERPVPGDQTMVDLRLVELDEPVGDRQVEHNIFTTQARHRRRGSWISSSASGTTPAASSRTRLRAAAARRAEEPGRRPPAATGVEHDADAEVVRRSVGAPLRPLPRHQLRVHEPRRVSRIWPRRRRRPRPARSATPCRACSARARPTTGRSSARRWR